MEGNVTEPEVSQDSAAIPQSETQTTDPGSVATTEQIVVIDSSLTPELESLSSGSDPEDQFYEASEEPTVDQRPSPAEAVDAIQDRETEGTAEDVEQKGSGEGLASVEEYDGGGMSKAVGDTCSSGEQQYSMDSVDKEFVMVNYPTITSSDQHSDTQQPHVEQNITTSTSPQDNIHVQQATTTSPQVTGPIIDSSGTAPTAIEDAQTVQLEDGNQSSLSPMRVEIVSAATQPEESAESAQMSADGSQEATGGRSDHEGGQRETEGEARGGSEVAIERESSDAEGEKSGQVKGPAFESLGLLYASSPNIKHNRDLMKPADEVAEDVLEVFPDIEAGSEPPETPLSPDDGREKQLGAGYLTIDPGVVIEMEKRAQTVAAELSHVMGNLRNSLHAMTVCTKQSIQLHRESVDNLHSVVDTNIKGMYTFMAKFEELNKSLSPLQQIAAQIHDIDEKLKLLEQSFRVTASSAKASQVQSSIRAS